MERGFNQVAKIKVIGVGGGGGNAVNRMVNEGVEGVEFVVANTDAQVLSVSQAPTKLILGEKISKGLGAGANPEIGRKAAEESEQDIKRIIDGADLVFVAAGMGGGTGTGAAPVIARIAQECGALVVAIVTKPFSFEGKNRNNYAREGLVELKKFVDSIIVISNDKLLEYIGGLPIQDSFREADNILKQGVQTITDLIAVPAVINLDFADVKTVMSKKGNALFGIGIAQGEDKAVKAANKAISSSLLDASVKNAKDVIVNVTGDKTVTLNDAYDAVDVIQQAVNNEQVNIVFGIAINEQLNDEIIVTVIATGFDNQKKEQPLSSDAEVELDLTSTTKADSLSHLSEFGTIREVNEDLENKQNGSYENSDDDFPTFLR